jgi:DNA modification methylase
LVCLAGVVEASSKLRKDGRALRYEPNKQPCDPYIEFDRRAGMVSEDLAKRKIVVGSAKAILGDARLASMMLPAHAEFDLIVFSPPYPNNIDYTEVYKLEAWSLGFYEDYAAFREQRLLTLRSHPSIKFPDNFEISSNGFRTRFNRAVTPLRRAIPKDKDHAWRDRLVHGYFDDMLRVLVEMHSLLADDGQLAFVVGNSLHGSKENYFLVAADLLIAEIAESAGYRVSDFIVARQLPRKSGDYEHLRESVVILRKSDSPRGKHHA